jgi:hypothetical protein
MSSTAHIKFMGGSFVVSFKRPSMIEGAMPRAETANGLQTGGHLQTAAFCIFLIYLDFLVGAAGFEPTTPSPPDRGGVLFCLIFFAKCIISGLPKINNLGPVLQTVF